MVLCAAPRIIQLDYVLIYYCIRRHFRNKINIIKIPIVFHRISLQYKMVLNLFRAENLPDMMSVWPIYYKLWIFVIVNYPYHQQHRVLCLLKSVSTRFFVHAEKYDYKLFIFLLFTSFASFFSFSSRFRYQIARIIITFDGLLIWLILVG